MQKLSVHFIFLVFILTVTGCVNEDPIPLFNEEDNTTMSGEKSDDIEEEDSVKSDSDKDETSDTTDDESSDKCVLDRDCNDGYVCIPDSVGSISGTCEQACQQGNCPSGTECNKKIGRCINNKAPNVSEDGLSACGEDSCTSGCCIAGDGLRSMRCDESYKLCDTCGPCKQGEICSPTLQKCVSASCDSDSECTTWNSHIMLEEEQSFMCSETAICAISGGDSGTNSGECATELQQCETDPDNIMDFQGNCCDGLTCLLNFCMPL